MSDLVQMLRLAASGWRVRGFNGDAELTFRAANRIEELQAQVDRMETVLKERVPRSVYEAAIKGDK